MVIRRALEQSAQPLAMMHLRSPSEELERMLLDVLVSAYRVLDPRRRADPQSRVMLGRLHPQLADEAAQLAQARLTAPQSPSLNAVIPPPVEKDERRRTEDGGRRTVDVQGTPIAERSATPGTEDVQQSATVERSATWERFIDTAMVPGWEETLSSPDLLVQLPTTRAYRAARRQFANAPFASVVAIIVLAGSVLLMGSWWAVVGWRDSADQQQIAAAADSARQAEAWTPTATAGQAEAWTPTGQAKAWTPTVPTAQAKAWTPTVPTGQAEAWTPAATTAQAEAWTPAATTAQAEASTPAATTAQAEASTPAATTAQAEASTPTAEAALPAVPAAGDASAALAASSRPEAPAVGLAALDQGERPELPIDLDSLMVPEVAGDQESEPDIAAARPAVPPQSQQAAARLHVETLVRSYRSKVAEAGPDEIQLVTAELALGPGLADDLVGPERQIVLLRAVASESPAGSAQRWVATVLAGQAALLANRAEDTQQAIAELTQSFAIDADQATLQLASWAAGDIVSTVQRQRVGQWIDQQVRSYVLDGELAVASQLAGIAHELGVKHRDEPIKAQSKLWRDSLAVAQRYAEAAERLDAVGADQVSAEERATVGRYWALVRRDWHRALPHLAAGSNAKLAHYAGIELLAGAVLDAQDATFLADGYLTEAKRAKGWLSDSYVLHAHELLVAASKAAGQAEALELTQAAEKLRAEQPAAFVGMAKEQTAKPPAAGAQQAVSTAQPQEAAML